MMALELCWPILELLASRGYLHLHLNGLKLSKKFCSSVTLTPLQGLKRHVCLVAPIKMQVWDIFIIIEGSIGQCCSRMLGKCSHMTVEVKQKLHKKHMH